MNFLFARFLPVARTSEITAHFATCPVWESLKYLIKLTTLLAIIGLVSFIPVASEMVETFAQWADQHLPAFALKDGKVQTEVETTLSNGRQLISRFILDTTGKNHDRRYECDARPAGHGGQPGLLGREYQRHQGCRCMPSDKV